MPIYREISVLQKLGMWKTQQKVQKQSESQALKSSGAQSEGNQDASNQAQGGALGGLSSFISGVQNLANKKGLNLTSNPLSSSNF